MAKHMLNACKVSIKDARAENSILIGTGENEFNANEVVGTFLQQAQGEPTILDEDVFIVEEYEQGAFNNNTMTTFTGKNKKGSAGSTAEVYDTVNSMVTYTTNENEAVMKPFNFKIYIANGETEFMCIFHRYGRSGSKSAFIARFRKYIKDNYEKVVVIKNIVPPDYMDQILGGDIKMLTLTREARVERQVNDIADELDENQWLRQANTEYIVKAKRRKNLNGMKDALGRLFRNEVVLSELFTIPDVEYDNAKITLNTNGMTKTIDLSQIQFYFCDNDVTNDLILEHGHPTGESINTAFDNYYNELMAR